MKKIIAMLMAASMLFSLLAGCGSETAQTDTSETEPAAVETVETTEENLQTENEAETSDRKEFGGNALQLLGELDSSVDIGKMSYNSYGLTQSSTLDDKRVYSIIDTFGVDNLQETYDKVSYVDEMPGYYVVIQANDTPNNTGLVNEDGTVYIPCEAAIIERMNDRFFEVTYATEETDDENEALLYSTENMFSLTAAEGDILYKGYIKVFDIEAGDFVPNLECTDSAETLYGFGKVLLKNTTDRTCEVYGADGTLLTTWDSLCSVRDGYVYYDQMLFDDDLNVVASYTEGTILIHGDEFFYEKTEDGNITIMDDTGDILISEPAYYATVIGDFLEFSIAVSEDERMYELWSLQGEKLSEPVFEYINESDLPGYLYSETGDDAYTIIYPDGSMVELTDVHTTGTVYGLCFIKDNEIFVINDKDFTLCLEGDVEYLMPGLITAKNALGKIAVFDYITGEQLTDYLYMSARSAGGHIYLEENGSWSVYDYPIN